MRLPILAVDLSFSISFFSCLLDGLVLCALLMLGRGSLFFKLFLPENFSEDSGNQYSVFHRHIL
jgi:hypothetical protein